VNRRRLFQTGVLVVGLTGLALTVASTLDDASEQVMPGPGALAAGAALALAAILTSGRAWVALFHETLHDRGHRMRFEGNYYVSQLTKYLPAGGAVQAASQVSMASAAGVPLGRVALAFPVSAVGSIAAGATIGSGLALVSDLPAWARASSLLGLATPALLHRRFLAGVLEFGRRFVRRIPATDRLPSQRRILSFYAWAVVSMGCTAGAYTVLLQSLSDEASPGVVFVAYAMSWTVGFLAVPLPAGIGVREAVLVACLPGVGAAPLIAASLAHRLLGIGAELTAAFGTKAFGARIVSRAQSEPARPEPQAEEVAAQDDGAVPPLSHLHRTD
jgi:glycosyltransferase 2 family protein